MATRAEAIRNERAGRRPVAQASSSPQSSCLRSGQQTARSPSAEVQMASMKSAHIHHQPEVKTAGHPTTHIRALRSTCMCGANATKRYPGAGPVRARWTTIVIASSASPRRAAFIIPYGETQRGWHLFSKSSNAATSAKRMGPLQSLLRTWFQPVLLCASGFDFQDAMAAARLTLALFCRPTV
jgi:hypothetical protein